MFTLAMIQMRVVGGDKQANLDHAVDLIDEAAQHGAQVMLLPEALNLRALAAEPALPPC